MIYVTGDLHGDIMRLKSKEMRRLKKNDYLIVCGDFGFVWDDSKAERKLLKWLGKRRFHILFVEGCHDNLDLINSYPLVPWQGGMVHEISGRLKHLVRGSVFELEGKKVFAFGGGESKDADSHTEETWWPQELPTMQELEAARNNLEAHGNMVDYIVTHQGSRKIKRFLAMHDNDANILDVFLDQVRDNCKYARWFFGGYHINKVIPPSEMALFTAIVPVSADKLQQIG